MWGTTREDWEPLRQAAMRFKDVLVIVPAGQGAEPVYPAALGLDNVLAVEQGTASVDAVGFGGSIWRVSGTALAVAAAGRRRQICWRGSPAWMRRRSSAVSATLAAGRCGGCSAITADRGRVRRRRKLQARPMLPPARA